MRSEPPTKVLNDCVCEDAPICYGILKPGENHAGGIPVVKVRNIRNGKIAEGELIRTSRAIDQQYRRSKLKAGDILMTIRGTAGDLALVPDGLEGANITQDTARIRIRPAFNRDYVFCALHSPIVQRQVRLHTIGQAVKGINIAEVRKLSVYWPDEASQRWITHCLQTWRCAIDLTERLIAAKQQRRKWLMQQLLTGKRRLPGFTDKWREGPLHEVTEESAERSHGQLTQASVRAVNKILGMVPMRQRTIADDVARYKVVRRGWFAYNPMRLNIGSICMWDGDEDVLVSPDYVVFRSREEVLDPRYLNYLRQGHRWERFVRVAGNGTVRVRIYYSDLELFRFRLPSLPEQKRMVAVLTATDREIDLLDQSVTALREQKKGLMQQLLTGKRRVLGSAAKAEARRKTEGDGWRGSLATQRIRQ